PGASSGHRSRSNDERSIRGTHQGQQSARAASTGRTHDCKRRLHLAGQNLLQGGGHPHMRRRHLLPMFAALLAAWPLSVDPQQPRIPVVGFVGYSNPERGAAWLAALHKGMAEGGFVEGRTLVVEYRWADSDWSRVPALVSDLVGRRVDVFVAPGGAAVQAAKEATKTIPIVFAGHNDPVAAGYVESLKRPGGNVTGVAGSYDE